MQKEMFNLDDRSHSSVFKAFITEEFLKERSGK